MRTLRTRITIGMSTVFALSVACLFFATFLSMSPVPNLALSNTQASHVRLLARDRSLLTTTYQNHWNVHEQQSLEQMPRLLSDAVIAAEDRRFFEHQGIDWQARVHALWQNIQAGRKVRGASTITEQVVRMFNPRPRGLWARWLEGFEAERLESEVSKNDILEFYLNQVPYAANRRGVAQAARYYFDRSVSTLSPKEILALAVLIRAPSRFDLWNHPGRAESRIQYLADKMRSLKVFGDVARQMIANDVLQPQKSFLNTQARHFARFVLSQSSPDNSPVVETTLDPSLQDYVQEALDRHIRLLRSRNVHNGAALLVDHQSNEVLAWVVGGARLKSTPGAEIDAVTVLRQPGSTLKPFVYAQAISKGWTAATLISDEPIAQAVGNGLHPYKNYSRTHYGLVSVRDALGNSLNIPALKALQYVGVEAFLRHLQTLGIKHLNRHPTEYGDGLALGNGEVSLFELVQAFSVLARTGQYAAIQTRKQPNNESKYRVYDSETASLLGNILSDSNARLLEFGPNSVLNFPHQTAIKTGTSSDHTDSWAVGFNHRFTLGVWIGNLDRSPMHKVTGANGPAYVLRSVFSELSRHYATKPLYLSPKLVRREVCLPRQNTDQCQIQSEWFSADQKINDTGSDAPKSLFVRYPSEGLSVALDPRIPDELERFRFELNNDEVERVTWIVDGDVIEQNATTYLWQPSRGLHHVKARVWLNAHSQPTETRTVNFSVH